MVRNEVLTRKVVGIWLATCLKPLNCTGESIRIRFKVILIKLNIRLIIRLLNKYIKIRWLNVDHTLVKSRHTAVCPPSSSKKTDTPAVGYITRTISGQVRPTYNSKSILSTHMKFLVSVEIYLLI
ncbi:hypothetical protein SFRURICE_019717 [Spodoptera frugiperda]|nr:hypothetical protein SFRURICE_019717 [Spodoptera frugiperda]